MMDWDNGNLFSFEDLKVWEKAVIFAEKIIQTIDEINTPRKHYRLIEQLESASTSVAMNIAEGKGRQTTKEFIQFLYIDRGSLFEVVTLLIIFQKAGWLESKRLIQLRELAEEITKKLNSFIKAMRNSR